MMPARNYVTECVAGHAFLKDIDDWVSEWHAAEEDGRSLADYLGMTEDEHSLWVERPSALGFIIATLILRAGTPVPRTLSSTLSTPEEGDREIEQLVRPQVGTPATASGVARVWRRARSAFRWRPFSPRA